MSQATARQIRRATRKLVGDEGQRIVEIHSALLTGHTSLISGLQDRNALILEQIKQLRQEVEALKAHLRDRPQTLGQRLRWLITGAGPGL